MAWSPAPNAGNTPYRFMPQAWAYGGGALDEAEDKPAYKRFCINNEGTKAALQVSYDMYVRDKSVPRSALTNTQTENQDPFVAGQLGMMISHPSEYAVMIDKAKRATGADKAIAEAVVANMRYGLIPNGPVAAFGGVRRLEHPHLQAGDRRRRSRHRRRARRSWRSPRVRNGRPSSPGPAPTPATRRGFRTNWMKQRLEQIKFLNVTTSMLPTACRSRSSRNRAR